MPGSTTRCCEQCSQRFNVEAARADTARYCSQACYRAARAAAGRVTLTCEHCGTAFTVRRNRSAGRRYCSRTCMFTGGTCRWCAKVLPADTSGPLCSKRCTEMEALLLAHERGEPLRSRCRMCEQVLPAEQFSLDSSERNGLCATCRACTRSKYRANPERYKQAMYRRRAGVRARTVPFTSAEQAQRWAMWGGRCWVCGIADATEEDHVKPVSAGGWHALSNLRPICTTCNARKQATWPLTAAYRFSGYRHADPRQGADQPRKRDGKALHTCAHCGIVRLIRAACARAQQFCSTRCKNAAKTMPSGRFRCLGCDKLVTVAGHTWAQMRKYCSTDCAYEHRRQQGRVAHTCAHCGALRMLTPSVAARRTYCSPACKAAGTTRPPVTFTCERCGAVKTVPGYKVNQHRRFCSATCQRNTGASAPSSYRESEQLGLELT
jgi:hypothetical protein